MLGKAQKALKALQKAAFHLFLFQAAGLRIRLTPRTAQARPGIPSTPRVAIELRRLTTHPTRRSHDPI